LAATDRELACFFRSKCQPADVVRLASKLAATWSSFTPPRQIAQGNFDFETPALHRFTTAEIDLGFGNRFHFDAPFAGQLPVPFPANINDSMSLVSPGKSEIAREVFALGRHAIDSLYGRAVGDNSTSVAFELLKKIEALSTFLVEPAAFEPFGRTKQEGLIGSTDEVLSELLDLII